MNTSTNKKMPVEKYDRVCGYFSSTVNMNKGKKDEQANRKRFDANAYCKKEFSEENFK